jgi:hypothetical protein
VAPLTKGGQVPFLAIGFIVVEVMNSERVSPSGIVRVTAPFAFISTSLAKSVSKFLGPRGRIFTNKFAHLIKSFKEVTANIFSSSSSFFLIRY